MDNSQTPTPADKDAIILNDLPWTPQTQVLLVLEGGYVQEVRTNNYTDALVSILDRDLIATGSQEVDDYARSLDADPDRLADQFPNILPLWHPLAQDPAERLEQIRAELEAERISTGELIELQQLIPHIDPSDVQLLEAAGVPEFPDEDEDADPASTGPGEPPLADHAVLGREQADLLLSILEPFEQSSLFEEYQDVDGWTAEQFWACIRTLKFNQG